VCFAVSFDYRRGLEPVYGFDLGAEAVVSSVCGQFDDGIVRAVLARSGCVDLGVEPCGPLQCLSGSVKDAMFVGSNRICSNRRGCFLSESRFPRLL
jgi:hypothetical protein